MKGFTLIELMVVIAIVGIGASVFFGVIQQINMDNETQKQEVQNEQKDNPFVLDN